MKYYIGVDGGGTKSIVALFDENKNQLDAVKTSGSNHENLAGSFDEAADVIMGAVDELLAKNKLTYDSITGCLMGLAGIDHQWQHDKLADILTSRGLKNFYIYNDGFIITKAGLPDGIGIGYNCGTGTCCNSFDEDGNMLQIGGFGDFSQDKGNGHWIAFRTFTAIYDDVCLGIRPTAMTKAYFALKNQAPTRENVLDIVGYIDTEDEEKSEPVIRMLLDVYFDALNGGDAVALAISREMAERGAEYITAHLKKQNFGDNVKVVLSGSMHAKLPSKVYVDMLKDECNKRANGKALEFITLSEPPIKGCINWLLEKEN